jgi:hypothetical protein
MALINQHWPLYFQSQLSVKMNEVFVLIRRWEYFYEPRWFLPQIDEPNFGPKLPTARFNRASKPQLIPPNNRALLLIASRKV